MQSWMHACMHTYIDTAWIPTGKYDGIHVWILAQVYIDMHSYTHTSIRTHLDIYACISACIHMYRRMCLHTHSYIHTQIHTYIHTYIHAYIHKLINTDIDTYIYIYIYRHTDLQTYRHIGIRTYGQTDSQKGRHANVHAYLHATKTTYTHSNIYIYIYIYVSAARRSDPVPKFDASKLYSRMALFVACLGEGEPFLSLQMLRQLNPAGANPNKRITKKGETLVAWHCATSKVMLVWFSMATKSNFFWQNR